MNIQTKHKTTLGLHILALSHPNVKILYVPDNRTTLCIYGAFEEIL